MQNSYSSSKGATVEAQSTPQSSIAPCNLNDDGGVQAAPRPAGDGVAAQLPKPRHRKRDW
jgi:hypothetical protein